MPPHTNHNADTAADTRLNAPKPLRLALLGFAVAMLVLTAIALACGPAAPGGQSGGGDNGTAATATPEATATGGQESGSSNSRPTATPTPTPVCDAPLSFDNSNPACWPPPPLLTDFNKQYQGKLTSVTANFIQGYEAAMAAAAEASADGAPAPTPTPWLEGVRISLYTADRVDDLRKLLKDSGATEIECFDYTSASGAHFKGCGAYVPVSRMRHIADQDWVLSIREFPPPQVP